MSAGRARVTGTAVLRTRPRGWRATYGRDRRRSWFRLMLASPAALASCAFIATVALAAIFSPLIVPYDPRYIDPAIRLQPPTLAHLLGTDELGRDIFSRLIEGGRVSLLVGAVVTFVSASIVLSSRTP